MVVASPAGAIVFWDPLVALTLIGLAGGVVLVGRLFNMDYSSGWANKLIGLSWFGFTSGVVGALPYLDSPTSLGAAVAFAILSLLYAVVALILGLIWLPKAMPADDGSLPTGLNLAAPLVTLVSLMLAGLALTVF